jgi:hypothetical protein
MYFPLRKYMTGLREASRARAGGYAKPAVTRRRNGTQAVRWLTGWIAGGSAVRRDVLRGLPQPGDGRGRDVLPGRIAHRDGCRGESGVIGEDRRREAPPIVDELQMRVFWREWNARLTGESYEREGLPHDSSYLRAGQASAAAGSGKAE